MSKRNQSWGDAFWTFGLIVLVVVVIVLYPIVGIWIIETLWGIHIDLDFKTWLASLMLFAAMGGPSAKSTK